VHYIGIGRRSLAWAVDLLIMGGVIAALGDYREGPGYEVSWLGWRYVIAFWVVPFSYLVLFEWLVNATPGKLLVGIRVRTEGGTRIGLGRSLGRNIARLVDALPYVIPYLVGAVAISRSPTRQRLGDRWAGTVVVRWGSERDPAAAAVSALPEAPAVATHGLPMPPSGEAPPWPTGGAPLPPPPSG
jgi:uncharacterized RDD family membrane protein YckC